LDDQQAPHAHLGVAGHGAKVVVGAGGGGDEVEVPGAVAGRRGVADLLNHIWGETDTDINLAALDEISSDAAVGLTTRSRT
jgi:hypothetical protein